MTGRGRLPRRVDDSLLVGEYPTPVLTGGRRRRPDRVDVVLAVLVLLAIVGVCAVVVLVMDAWAWLAG